MTTFPRKLSLFPGEIVSLLNFSLFPPVDSNVAHGKTAIRKNLYKQCPLNNFNS